MGNEEFKADGFPRAVVSANADPLEGRVFGDNYEIEALIGVGGMGRVYRATQRALARTVGVKVIHPHLLEDDDTVSRFYTEARAASSLNHPNSVSIFDFGRTDDGMLYLVMEFLRGRDLAALMAEGPVEIHRCVDLACGVLAALGEAHARNVVHCDLKPENIIIERLRSGSDLVKVVDFGLAKILGSEPTNDQRKGLVSGTPDYMSPEQARAIEVDGRGDLYALGVVLFELMTGRLPFLGKTATEVMTSHVMDKPPHPRSIAPARNIPESVAQVVLRALAKSPDDRFADAQEMSIALRDALPAQPPKGARTVCHECGSESEARRKFCGECGARLEHLAQTLDLSTDATEPMPSPAPSLRGREEELKKLEALRTGAGESARLVHLFGPPGVGKTALVTALASLATQAGDEVVRVGAHESGAPVGFAHVRGAIAGLLAVREEDLRRVVEEGELFDTAAERAGMAELASPHGLPGLPGQDASEAVALALGRAVEVASQRARTRRVVLILDDLDRGDGLTPTVLRALFERFEDLDVMVVAVESTGHLLRNEASGLRISLGGLAPEHAEAFVPPGLRLPELPGGGFSPLHAEQLRALGWAPSPDDPHVPALADAFARRLDELDASARRLLQTVAVLGTCAPVDLVRSMASFQEMESASVLTEAGLAIRDEDRLCIIHPFVRDLVHESIPAETRRSMHRRALDRLGDLDGPLEQRVEHACRAGELMTALVLLERMGVDALDRGDARTSVSAFQRGLELARRELLETGDTALDRAIASFSRRLGEALLRAGDAPQAAGVVREAIELVYNDARARAQMLCLLAEVAIERGRPAEARAQLELARGLAARVAGPHLAVHLASTQAHLHQSEGESLGACNALVEAWASATASGEPAPAHALLGIELAGALMDIGDLDGARGPLDLICAVAESRGHAALMARALGTLGSLEELSGARERACTLYVEAADRAEVGGDVGAAESWRRAATALSGH